MGCNCGGVKYNRSAAQQQLAAARKLAVASQKQSSAGTADSAQPVAQTAKLPVTGRRWLQRLTKKPEKI